MHIVQDSDDDDSDDDRDFDPTAHALLQEEQDVVETIDRPTKGILQEDAQAATALLGFGNNGGQDGCNQNNSDGEETSEINNGLPKNNEEVDKEDAGKKDEAEDDEVVVEEVK